MKVCLNVNADSISALALNMGSIAVDVGGVELTELIDAVNANNCTLRIADEPGHVHDISPLPPTAILRGIQCSTAHITEEDNRLLYNLSHQHEDDDNNEWIHFSSTGYLLRLSAWQYPVLRLKRMGLSASLRRLVVTLMQRYDAAVLHLDAEGDHLPSFATFEW
ncbi:DUF5983 family protein [Kluyvera cryocrescens]|uniref:DUF5983 family protein n=1 Tax=Kluyvera cryocrescens TaxID=580 RepID=UPI0039F65EB1